MPLETHTYDLTPGQPAEDQAAPSPSDYVRARVLLRRLLRPPASSGDVREDWLKGPPFSAYSYVSADYPRYASYQEQLLDLIKLAMPGLMEAAEHYASPVLHGAQAVGNAVAPIVRGVQSVGSAVAPVARAAGSALYHNPFLPLDAMQMKDDFSEGMEELNREGLTPRTIRLGGE